MAIENKQDSNFTELRYAVEESPGVLPTTPDWIPAEPNEYKDFGGTVKTKARNPINASRQRKKGVVVDLDAVAGFVQDVTPDNTLGAMQSFMFAATREKTNDDSTAVNTDRYVVASGGTDYLDGDLVFAKDFDATANNGLQLVEAGSDATHVAINGTLTNATAQEGNIKKVGIEFAAGVLSANATPSDFSELVAANVAATGTLTLTGNAVAAETVTLGTQTYTWRAAVGVTADEVKIGANASDSIDNLVAAINKAAGGGVTYGSATVANADATAAAGAGDTMVATAITTGVAGNLVASTKVMTNATWGATKLAGGVGRDLTTLGLIPGEPIFVGSEVTGSSFDTDEDNGFCRVREAQASKLILDKTQFEFVDDNGAAKSIRIFFGDVLKNEVERSLIIKRTLQMERSLGAPDSAQPTQIQGEYITRCMADTCKLDAKTADLMTAEFGFLGGTHETVTGAEGLKTGTRSELVESDAFNTTNDVTLIKMAVVTDGDSCPDPLFAYLTDLSLSIKNNLKQNKAISVLGAFDVTPGTFEVSAEVTAYFQNVTAIEQVKSNATVTLEAHFVKANRGISIDIPLITLGKAQAEVKQDEAIMLPLSSDAATAKYIDPTLDYTLLWVFWPYLPDTAE